VAIGLARLGDLIEDLKLETTGKNYIIHLKPRQGADLSIPIWAATLKCEMLEKVLGSRVEFKA
jgi:hypothetical protein